MIHETYPYSIPLYWSGWLAGCSSRICWAGGHRDPQFHFHGTMVPKWDTVSVQILMISWYYNIMIYSIILISNGYNLKHDIMMNHDIVMIYDVAVKIGVIWCYECLLLAVPYVGRCSSQFDDYAVANCGNCLAFSGCCSPEILWSRMHHSPGWQFWWERIHFRLLRSSEAPVCSLGFRGGTRSWGSTPEILGTGRMRLPSGND